jgi:hypothetical protein
MKQTTFKIILLVLIFSTILSCKNYVQVIRTAGVNTELKNNLLIYENDTLMISYSFWHEKGLMSFSIYNKLDKPIYVDWKKSSYIDNGVKLNYWRDEVITNSKFQSYIFEGDFEKGSSVSNSKKIERITFIPPKSNFYRNSFYIYPKDYFNLKTTTEFEVHPRNDDSTIKTNVYSVTFARENTPIVFRNFITFSFNEKFETEFYIDNEFWLTEILEMDQRHFEYPLLDYESPNDVIYLKDKNGRIKLFCDYNSGKSFYLRIPREKSIENRKTAESMQEKTTYIVEPK